MWYARPPARMLLRGGIVVAALWATACASSPAVARRQPVTRPLPEIHRQRLNRVHADAPEVAELVVRIHRLASEYAARGEIATAEELAALARVTLLSTSELLARLEIARLQAGSASAPVIAADIADQAEPDSEPGGEVTEREARRETRRRRRAARRADVAMGPEVTPEVAEAAENGGSDPLDGGDAVSGRLAHLASRLSEIEPTEETRVVIEGVQTRLIGADRALAEGLFHRAAELATEAEHLLASLTGGSAPAPAATDGSGFLRDMRDRLGSRGGAYGSEVAVQLDTVVRWQDRSWRARAVDTLDGLRALVRGYRSAGLTLVTVGEPTSSAFAQQRDALTSYLARRFQIQADRLRWVGSVRLPLSRGTYLIISQGEDGG